MSADPIRAVLDLLQAGRLADAAEACDQVLQSRPTFAPALCLAGMIALQRGDYPRALQRTALAISLDPRNPQFNFSHGEALTANRRFSNAAVAYRRALQLDPRNAAAESGLGFALQMAGDARGALDAFRRAAALDPNAAEIQINLGAALQHAGLLEEALSHLARANTLAPGHPEAQYNIGVVLQAKGDLAGAETAYRSALAQAPGHARALNNLGVVLERGGRSDAALPLLDRVVAAAPDFPEARFNRGNVLKELGRFDEAILSYDRALALNSTLRDARKNRALARLTLGDFVRGWRDHLARDLPRPHAVDLDSRLLAGLAGKTVLLRREQGVGDELFFLAFAPLLVARGIRMIAEVDPRLVDMMERTGVFAKVVALPRDAGPVAGEFYIGDLPLLLGHGAVEDCPPPLAIPPIPERVAAMRARLAALGRGPFLAVTWRAGIIVEGRYTKTIKMDAVAAALARARGRLVAVQRKPEAGEVDAFAAAAGRPVADFTNVNDDLEDMLALISLVDEYVALSNTNVHLKTATGTGSRVLVPHPPEWRLLAEGDTSPWYPGSRLYRQTHEGDWSHALGRLKADLG